MLATTSYYRSNGKLLLSGEYLVLKGAKALAVPCIPGQSLSVIETETSQEWRWTTAVEGKEIQELILDSDLEILARKNPNFSTSFLEKVFQVLLRIKPELRNNLLGKHFRANVEFPLDSGLGSSSSLLANLSQWTGIDPFALHFESTNGSGYDIACALSDSPILYRLENKHPHIQKIVFSPPFRDHLFFLHLGKKQNSEKSVKKFQLTQKSYKQEIEIMDQISDSMANAGSIDDFEYLMREHEQLMSVILKETPIKQAYFKHFDGEIKSLGAWGGDFVMLSWQNEPEALKRYFSRWNLNQILSFAELIKTGE